MGGTTVPGPGRRDLSYDDLDLGEPLGSGGNATVHRAILPDGTTVAVKQPAVEGTVTRAAADRFLAEAETWADIDDHPHVVGLVDWDAAPVPWIAMEYMDGGSLADRLADGPLPFDEALRVGQEVCRAVRHAHRHGVVHLDLKPANVLFRETDGPDVAKVADWGLARSLRESGGTVEGLSPRYAAPEQFDPDEFGDPDDYTDIYGVGAVVYAALTGRPPFEGSGVAVMRAVVDGTPTPPSEVNGTLPAAVDDVVLRALATEKEDRYETVVDLRRALAALAEGDGGTDAVDADGADVDSATAGPDGNTTDAGSESATGATDDTESEPPSAAAAEPVDAIRGIGSTYSERLGEGGIETTADVLAADTATLADAADAPEWRVEKWQDRARQFHEDGNRGTDGESDTADDGPADGAWDGDLEDGPVRGIVTDHSEYDTRPDTYRLLLESGDTVRTTASQVSGSPAVGDPVRTDLAVVDGDPQPRSVAPLRGRWGETVEGVLTDYTEYDTMADTYKVDLDDGRSVRLNESQVVGRVAELDPVEADVVTIDGETHATRVQPQGGGLAVAWADLPRVVKGLVVLLVVAVAISGLVALGLLPSPLGPGPALP